jgi:hypothetical protein
MSGDAFIALFGLFRAGCGLFAGTWWRLAVFADFCELCLGSGLGVAGFRRREVGGGAVSVLPRFGVDGLGSGCLRSGLRDDDCRSAQEAGLAEVPAWVGFRELAIGPSASEKLMAPRHRSEAPDGKRSAAAETRRRYARVISGGFRPIG